MDLVNTRLQTQAVLRSSTVLAANLTAVAGADLSARPQYAGPIDAAVQIVEQGGPGALMQGAGVRCLHYAPSALIFFFVYEAIKRQVVLGR